MLIIRYLEWSAIFKSCYVPNGQSIDSEVFQYKLHFLDALYQHLHNLFKKEEVTIIGGDYNVAPYKIDVHDDYATVVCYIVNPISV